MANTTKDRRVPMQVLSLGMPRTGTASIREALRILLDEPVYHAFELLDHVDHCPRWEAAITAKFSEKDRLSPLAQQQRQHLDEMLPLGDYAAVTDMPAVCFAEEMVAAYPHAKVILVERDIESWFRSFDSIIAAPMFHPANNIIAAIDLWFLGPVARVHHSWIRGWFGARTLEEMRSGARGHYRDYYAMVRRVTPPERLLEYELGSGWEPLCEFLGKPVPDVPFPKVNESAVMEGKFTSILARARRSIAYNFGVYVLPAAVAAGGTWWYYRR
ncbi:P-loop containing nucleoside triphosphate hydrolase protein [Microdochium trichocladiopsis]|uniref:P-loop containing nucleoside triphosphate hydrolase protein n=1 Tax=Microdochium trichocladiopsis TaxID=1682393 RepID=A0A9P8XXE4_9PEZI|nr:P-loop containing nucleoside triphosphate hydrolase protein [Microdochium trichocladiopsis]KAH7024572.1 P-loop containing nucleoside triphosphate hydrolase protein [Microdochium trichocladiopsis]